MSTKRDTISLPELQNKAFLEASKRKEGGDRDQAAVQINRTTEIILDMRKNMSRAGVSLYTGLGVTEDTAREIVERILCEGVR